MNRTLISRADDFGSCHSANLAIADAVVRGRFIRNVSCMAPGPMMDAGAHLLLGKKHIIIGMHLTLNAEWDLVKWPPLCPAKAVPGLVDEKGALLDSPERFLKAPPSLEEILREADAQLDFLTRLGLNITYVDSHMFPEQAVGGLGEALGEWAEKKGLLNHLRFYPKAGGLWPAPYTTLEEGKRALKNWLEKLGEGQHILILHPGIGMRDMLLFVRPGSPAPQVRVHRKAEYALLMSYEPENLCERLGIRLLRYDEAVPQV